MKQNQTRILSLLLAAAMLLTLLAACAKTPASEAQTADHSVTVTDMMGRTVTLDAPATRVVALSAADSGRGRFLQQFLISPLQRTVAVSETYGIPVLVGEDL